MNPTRRTLVGSAALLCAVTLLTGMQARDGHAADDPQLARYRTHVPARAGEVQVRTVHGEYPASAAGARLGRAALDSFRIYGGSGSLEGSFQTAAGSPDRQGWVGVDRTDDNTSFAVGDFSRVFVATSDLDPCATNTTPQMMFIDDGSSPANRPGLTTGGATSSTWDYGIPGGWVVNGDGGVGVGTRGLWNEVWSPEIELDDPATTLDDAIGGGLTVRYSAWMHLPLANGIFHVWSVRSWPAPGNGGWSEWNDRGFLYYSDTPRYTRREFDVGDLLVDGAQRVQLALGVIDLSAEFGLEGSDATPAPWLDDVELVKFTPTGPSISMNTIDSFHDGFPQSGLVYDPMNLLAQATRLDSGRDINRNGASILTGDSVVVRVKAVVPGTQLARPPLMTWFLRANALFDPVRTIPSTAVEILPGIWKGTVVGQLSTDAAGQPVPDTWFFDLPDGPPRNPSLIPEPSEPALYFPGDRLWVFFQAEDTVGNTTFDLLDPTGWDPPADGGLCGKRAGGPRPPKDPDQDPADDPDPQLPIPTDSLPGVWDIFGKSFYVYQPEILIWDDAPELSDYLALELALAENGIFRGSDYDVYRTREPESGNSHGLGASSGRGATPAQIASYDIIVHLGGTTSAPLLSDGSNQLGNDKSNDIGLLTAWRQQPRPRTVITFADRLGSAMASQGTVAHGYLLNTMGIGFVDADVSDQLGGIASPVVLPSGNVSMLQTSFSIAGGCGSLASRDEIVARTPLGAVHGHLFSTNGMAPIPGVAASVVRDRTVVIESASVRRLDVSFPFSFASIRQRNDGAPDTDARSARGELIAELLTLAGYSFPGTTPTSTPASAPGVRMAGPAPNPFNPSTVIALENDRVRELTVAVFDARGREVRTLHAGEVAAGRTQWEWDGRDDHGVGVSSGVYLVIVHGDGISEVRKAVLAK